MKTTIQSEMHQEHETEPALVERRQHRRVQYKAAGGLASGSNFYTGLSRNIGTGGIFVATYQLQPIGTVLGVEVSLSDGKEPLRLQGEVRWIRPDSPRCEGCSGMGVQFLDLGEQDRQRIEAFVTRRETIFYEE